jgi:hypothetical protein
MNEIAAATCVADTAAPSTAASAVRRRKVPTTSSTHITHVTHVSHISHIVHLMHRRRLIGLTRAMLVLSTMVRWRLMIVLVVVLVRVASRVLMRRLGGANELVEVVRRRQSEFQLFAFERARSEKEYKQ